MDSQTKIERKAAMYKSKAPVYRKAMSGKSRNFAIKAFCIECMGYSLNDSRKCTTCECPLYPYMKRKSNA